MKKENKKILLSYLKKLFKKEVVKKTLGAAAGGIKLFLVVTAIDYIWNRWLGPGVKLLLRKISTFMKSFEYKKKAKRLEDAKTNDEFDDSVDDLP